MKRLTQLASDDYRPCDWDLKADAAGRTYWLEHFGRHLDVLLPHIRQEYPSAPARQIEAFRTAYLKLFSDIAARPLHYDRLDILAFDQWRGALLEHYRFPDPFRSLKQRENEAAAALLPAVLAELDAGGEAEQRTLLALGLLAGNLFDLGAMATVEQYRRGNTAFRQVRAAQPPRPWLLDHVAAWWHRWDERSSGRTAYRHVLFFIDNAGSDIVLGCLPLVRWMLRTPLRVTLAANSKPALNDITAAELEPLLHRCGEGDAVLAQALADDRLRVLASGSAAPLLDLARLADGLVAATADADLIILHGMGRAVESNFHARFYCDVLWTAVLKDVAIAQRLGGRLFDCVVRFTPR